MIIGYACSRVPMQSLKLLVNFRLFAGKKAKSLNVANMKTENLNARNVKIVGMEVEKSKAINLNTVKKNVGVPKAEKTNTEKRKAKAEAEKQKAVSPNTEEVKVDEIKRTTLKAEKIEGEAQRVETPKLKTPKAKAKTPRAKNMKVEDKKEANLKDESIKSEKQKTESTEAKTTKGKRSKTPKANKSKVKSPKAKAETPKAEPIKTEASSEKTKLNESKTDKKFKEETQNIKDTIKINPYVRDADFDRISNPDSTEIILRKTIDTLDVEIRYKATEIKAYDTRTPQGCNAKYIKSIGNSNPRTKGLKLNLDDVLYSSIALYDNFYIAITMQTAVMSQKLITHKQFRTKVDFLLIVKDKKNSGLVADCSTEDTKLSIRRIVYRENIDEAIKELTSIQPLKEDLGPDMLSMDNIASKSLIEYLESFGLNKHLLSCIEINAIKKEQNCYGNWLQHLKKFINEI